MFSFFGAQPLTIAGVTGPITVFNKTIYDILARESNPPNYLQFVGWVYVWAGIFHVVAAFFNCTHNFLISLVIDRPSARVQLPAIRDLILMRHIRVLRELGVSAVWRTGRHPVPPLL